MAALSTQNLVDAGTPPTLSGSAATSDTALVGNGHNTFVYYENTDSAAHVVKIVAPGTNAYGQPNPDPTYNIAVGAKLWIPLRREYTDTAVAGVGRCTLNVFAADGTTPNATGVKVAVIQVG